MLDIIHIPLQPPPPHFSPFLHGQFTPQNIGAFSATSSHHPATPGRAVIRLEHRPYPRLAVHARGWLAHGAQTDTVGSLTIFEAENRVVGRHNHGTRWRQGQQTRSSWSILGHLDLPLNEKRTRIGHVVLNLYNFRQSPDGTNILYPYDLGVAARSVWHFGPWRLELDSLWQGSEGHKSGIQRDQFCLTHVALLERLGEDGTGKLFGADQAQDVCSFLEMALGFIEGGNVGPSLGAGRRETDPFVWVWPGPVLRSSKNRRTNWAFDHRYTGCMSVLEPLWASWRAPTQRDWLSRAVPIYLEASRNDVPWEIRIVVAQTGLEMMAALILVERDKVLSLGEYESLHTAAQIRALLAHLNLSAELPDWFAGKPRHRQGDLADALADVRNAIVHPTSSNRAWLRGQDSRSLDHAWNMFLEFLELSILYAVDYQGIYSTCTDSASFNSVPWTAKSAAP